MHITSMPSSISTRVVRLQPWLNVRNVEACFITLQQGALILKDRGKTLLDENLAGIHLANRPPDGTFATTHAQRLPDGGYVLASCRSKVGERNLQIFGPSGRFVRSFPIGDGIEHLAVDSRGRIWVGYFDEGIFGGDPLSAHGLSRFDQHGDLEYQWNGRPNAPIDDCDTLTLDDNDAAWICPYSPYFVAMIKGFETRTVLPKAPVSIMSGLLVGPKHLGFVGGIDFHGVGDQNGFRINVSPEGSRIEAMPKVGPDPTPKDSVVTIVSLETGNRTQVQILDQYSAPMTFRHNVSCRAGAALCWNGSHIYRFSLDSLLAA
ncbi:hypothetical protein [Novosphingobium sp.]|uniref:hypothetical protein n=1 Tax=Novosphingobium sp. TaxID=1874826 RepID=UPI0031E125E6